MKRLTAAEIKAFGPSVWGLQSGLLSVAELELLEAIIELEALPITVLEVGHYYGLSTCVLVRAMQARTKLWHLFTIDAHIPDACVPHPAPLDAFMHNFHKHFFDERVTVGPIRSEGLVAPLPFGLVFYDGDHGAEQERFTRAVIESPVVRTFVFDDRDFEVPARCCELLRDAGWHDDSPKLARLKGDKQNPKTMTMGVFRR